MTTKNVGNVDFDVAFEHQLFWGKPCIGMYIKYKTSRQASPVGSTYKVWKMSERGLECCRCEPGEHFRISTRRSQTELLNFAEVDNDGVTTLVIVFDS